MKAKETLIPRYEEPAALSQPPRPAAASVVGISKSFGKASVLENISFDVAEGEVLVLLGDSGSGKDIGEDDRARCKHELHAVRRQQTAERAVRSPEQQ